MIPANSYGLTFHSLFISMAASFAMAVPALAQTANPVQADDPAQLASAQDVGLTIATETRERARGFGNFTARQAMLLRNRQGQESRREMRIKVLEVEGDGDRSLFVFDEPRDVAGTAMLVHGHTVTSPAGTQSVVNAPFNAVLEDFPGLRDWELMSNAFYGENPNGEWRVQVVDLNPGHTGELSSWGLKFHYGDHP